MKLVDANVLLYAVDSRSLQHDTARSWLDAALTGQETVLLPWVCLLAFVRLSTHPRIFERPLSIDRALDVVDLWLAQRNVIVPEPDSRHSQRLRELLSSLGRGGNLVNDAHLASLAVQYGATVVTFDNDFGRFTGLAWEMPSS